MTLIECEEHGLSLRPTQQCPGCRRDYLISMRPQAVAAAERWDGYDIDPVSGPSRFATWAGELSSAVSDMDAEIEALGRDLVAARRMQSRPDPCPLDDSHAMETEAQRRELEYRRLCIRCSDD